MAKRRKNGEGTLRERKDGRWEGRIVVGYNEKGLPVTKNVLAKTKSECAEKLDLLKDETHKNISKVKSSMLFTDWIDFWYQNFSKPHIRKTTRQTYESYIYRQIIPNIGKIELNKLTSVYLQAFFGNLKNIKKPSESLSESVVRIIHALIKRSLKKARDLGLINRNPAEECGPYPKKKTEMNILSKEEMQRLLIQAKEDNMYEMLLLDLSTGLRRNELLALQWNDINFSTGELNISKQIERIDGHLVVANPKTEASKRTVILPKPLINILKEYRKTVNSEWVFPSPLDKNNPRDPSACGKGLSKILEHAQIKHIRFHDLRHNFATMALAYGMDVKTLAGTIGHSSVETTLNVYSHATSEMRIKAAEKIDTAIGGRERTKKGKISESTNTGKAEENAEEPVFEPYRGTRRKKGTGYIHRVSKNCWEGRYSPRFKGKRMAKSVYAKTKEECEIKLKELIQKTRKELDMPLLS